VPVAAFADAAAPAACAAVAVGRIGCLLAGCCFGVPSHVPWAVAFPAGTPAHVHHVALGLVARDAATSLPVHPLPLYVVLVLGAGFLAVVRRRRRADPGECALLALTVLGLGQAVLEPLRDTAFTPPVPLRQAIPLAMGLVGLAGVWWCQGRCRSSGGGDVRA
jgi:phosphatidylglycerol:prolipoprotein diacylglycerol transferase